MVDLSVLSDEELKDLPTIVGAELMSRGLVKRANVNAGKYRVSKDIPVGDYTIKNTSESSMNLIVRNKKMDAIYNLILNEEEESGRIELNEGDILEITEKTIISVFSGIQWY